ncbi:MAG: hypothetical protein RLZZ267_858 [Bacillota bacterium]|jgi:hypothetical protein
MKITKIEPTPSPNVMKLTMDESLNAGVRLNYTWKEANQAPSYLRQLLAIDTVTGVFQTSDFIALERHPKGDWATILEQVKGVLQVADGIQTQAATFTATVVDSSFGEVIVRVQSFRGIPMQVRVSAGIEEKRAALPDRFIQAAMEAGLQSPNLIMERKLEEHGIRYGELAEVLAEIVMELDAAFPDDRLHNLVNQSTSDSVFTDDGFMHPEWQKRYASIQQLQPTLANLPVFIRALHDSNTTIRRFAVAQLGAYDEIDTLPYILQALHDPSPIIRRTAGDVCSDKGDAAALPEMTELLQDSNKLVRWRAARFLYEMGGEEELDALESAADDPEFEIRLQIELAIARITNGGQAEGTVWQQMTRRNH